jgi:hypothetical protein
MIAATAWLSQAIERMVVLRTPPQGRRDEYHNPPSKRRGSGELLEGNSEIDDVFARFRAAGADHFNTTPDEVSSCCAGTLGRVADQLKDIAEFDNALPHRRRPSRLGQSRRGSGW